MAPESLREGKRKKKFVKGSAGIRRGLFFVGKEDTLGNASAMRTEGS
jgi:hypothetical protein